MEKINFTHADFGHFQIHAIKVLVLLDCLLADKRGIPGNSFQISVKSSSVISQNMPPKSFVESPSHKQTALFIWIFQCERDLLGCSNEPHCVMFISKVPRALAWVTILMASDPELITGGIPISLHFLYNPSAFLVDFDPKWIRPNSWPQKCPGVNRAAVWVITTSSSMPVCSSSTALWALNWERTPHPPLPSSQPCVVQGRESPSLYVAPQASCCFCFKQSPHSRNLGGIPSAWPEAMSVVPAVSHCGEQDQ